MRKYGTWVVEIVVIVLTIVNMVHVFEKPARGDLAAMSVREEFVLDAYRAGDRVDGQVLAHAYDGIYLTCLLLSFSVYVILGSVVLRLRPTDEAVRSFHLLMWSTAALIGITWTVRDSSWMDVLLRGSSVAVHAVFAVALVQFAARFPLPRASQFVTQMFTAVAIVISILGFASMIPIVKGWGQGSEFVDAHLAIHQFAQLYMKLAAVVVSMYFFVHTFSATNNARSLRQILWVFLGLLVSMTSYIGLWVVPRAVFGHSFIPEYILLLLACIAPIAFTIAILRYRVLDINVILQRSFVTAIIGAILFALLYGIHYLTVQLIGVLNGTISLVISVVVLIGLGRYYEPLKKLLQHWIDVRVFKITYDYRSTVRIIENELRTKHTLDDVYEYMLTTLDFTLTPQRSAVMLFDTESNSLRCVAEIRFGMLRKRFVPFDTLALKASLRLPIIVLGQAETVVECELADATVFNRWKIAAAQPIVGGKNDLIGFIVLGEKSNGRQITYEDADLLRTLAAQSALAIERLRFYHAMLLSTEEQRRLQELNDMKTTFVSAISHDLKVPLTAIRLMAELSAPSQQTEANKRRMEIIVGEADRLSGLIDNVLTYARIERGALLPESEPVDLNDVVQQTVHSLKYQAESLGFTTVVQLSAVPLVVIADNIHLLIILQNIIANAMKYSGDSKVVEITTNTTDTVATIDVMDHGIGIASEDLERIFIPFERAASVVTSNVVPGTGLGLAIVHELVQRNGGIVRVSSVVDHGSTFSISFPLSEEHS